VTDKVVRVGFAWQTLTSENLGVGALAEANLAIARAAGKRAGVRLDCIEFCHSELRPEEAASHGIQLADPLSPRRMLTGSSKAMQQLRACDVVLDIGEGDSFADIYGAKRFLLLSFLKWSCLRAGTALVVSPQTMGPFDSAWSRWVATRLLARAKRVFPRDRLSMDCLRGLGLSANTEEVIDVAFRLPFEKRTAPNDGRIHVGLNVSGLLYSGGYTRNNQFGLTVDYKALVDGLCDQLHARDDVVLHLVGHVISQDFAVEDDYRVCEQLAARLPRSVLAPRFRAPSEAKSYISGLHFFAGARMHACIGAFSSGVPVVPMAYSRKFNGLFQSLGYTALADMKQQDTATAMAAVLAGLEQRAALAVQVAAGNVQAQHKLQRYEDYLVELFGDLRDRAH
jgi:colanic acid/amylovoran biosynthesis protein